MIENSTLLIGAHTQCTRTAKADFCTSASELISPSDAPKMKFMPAADGSSGSSMRSQNTTGTLGITQQMANTSNADRTVSALKSKLKSYSNSPFAYESKAHLNLECLTFH